MLSPLIIGFICIFSYPLDILFSFLLDIDPLFFFIILFSWLWLLSRFWIKVTSLTLLYFMLQINNLVVCRLRKHFKKEEITPHTKVSSPATDLMLLDYWKLDSGEILFDPPISWTNHVNLCEFYTWLYVLFSIFIFHRIIIIRCIHNNNTKVILNWK